MAGKLTIMKNELIRQLKIISVSFNVIVNLLYIAYLRFAIKQGIGNRLVNTALVFATAIFLVVYIIFRLFGENKRNVKRTKRIYKRFKLLMKLFTVGTAVYTVVIAVDAVSPVATVLAIVNAVILGVRLIFELIVSLITRGARKVKNSVVEKRLNKKRAEEKVETSFIPDEVTDVEITADDLK